MIVSVYIVDEIGRGDWQSHGCQCSSTAMIIRIYWTGHERKAILLDYPTEDRIARLKPPPAASAHCLCKDAAVIVLEVLPSTMRFSQLMG